MSNEGSKAADDVAIVLGEREFFLIPTLRAHNAVNRRFSGFAGAYDALRRYDSGAMVAIIAAGLNQRDPEEIERIEERVYESGLAPLNAPLVRFLDLLMNGGRKPDFAQDEKADPAKKKLSQSEFAEILLGRATGWLHWTEADTLDTRISTIVLALENHSEMLTAIFGGGKGRSDVPSTPVRKGNLGNALRLLGGGNPKRQKRPKKK